MALELFCDEPALFGYICRERSILINLRESEEQAEIFQLFASKKATNLSTETSLGVYLI